MNDKQHLFETVKHAGDVLSIGTLIAVFVSWLPDIAAFLTVVWCVIRVYEMPTVRKVMGRFHILNRD